MQSQLCSLNLVKCRLLWKLIICIRVLNPKLKVFRTAQHPLMLYLLPSNQEEVYGCQVYAELLTETQQ